jgi:hypothetical protein
MKKVIDIHKKSSIFTVSYPAELLLLKFFGAIACILACTYVYLVSMTALNVIASREAATRAASLESTVGTMQQQYFSLVQEAAMIPPESLGLTPVGHTSYVYKPTTVGLLSPADNAN